MPDMAAELDARALLESLAGQQIPTATGRPNSVLALDGTNVLVGTTRSSVGELVPIEEVQDGIDRLAETGEVEIHPSSLGYRSSFVGAVLLTLPGTVLVRTSPPRIWLTDPLAAYRADEAGQINSWWAGDTRQRFWLEITDRADIGLDLHCPQRDSSPGGGRRTPGFSLIWWVQTGDVVFHYDLNQRAITAWSRAAGHVTEAPTIWLSHRAATRRRLQKGRAQPGWWLDLDGPFPVEPPLTLARIRENGPALRRVLDRLRADHPGSLYFPFSFYRGTQPRPQQPYLNKLPAEFVDLFPELTAAAGQTPELPGRATEPPQMLGTAYLQAQVSPRPTERQPFTVNPALVERGLQGHADTQNALAEALRQAGIDPRSRLPHEPISIWPGRPAGQSSSPRSRASPTTTKKHSSGSVSVRSCATVTVSAGWATGKSWPSWYQSARRATPRGRSYAKSSASFC
jgi:hypothetical protein